MAGVDNRQASFRRALALLLSLVAVFALWSGTEAVESASAHLSIGFSSRAFVNVPPQDTRIAVGMLARNVARKIVVSADAKVYDSIVDIERELKGKRLDAVALTPEDFQIARPWNR